MTELDDRLTALRDALSTMDPPADLWERAATRDVRLEPPTRRPSSRWLVAAAIVAAVAIGAAVLQSDDKQPVTTVPPTTLRQSGWSGPVRAPSDVLHAGAIDPQSGFYLGDVIYHDRMWDDPRDASEAWAEITRVSESHTGWDFTVAARPPQPADVEPGMVIAYGLVFDVNADGAADYVAGVATDGRVKGDFRVWLTDLATGVTDERSGPPYGYPVEFSYPGEAGAPDPSPPDMRFLFLGGALPAHVDIGNARFYAWTSLSRDGVVFAYDFAPNTGWLVSDVP